VAYTLGLAAAAERLSATLRGGFRVEGVRRHGDSFELVSSGGDRVRARVVLNCAGLRADEVARLAGDDSFEIYPRKGEFLVFDPPTDPPLREILLPVPTERTKGVLVFPTIDGKVIAGPTAIDGEDKDDWSVRSQARDEIVPKAVAMHPALDGAGPVAAYAGLRPAGRGVNYLIGHSAACPGLVNVAAIRSTGLTASLGIAEHVSGLVRALGVALGEDQPIQPCPPPALEGPWWRRAAEYRGA
jgi:glycerol-3-phosphate dehydrogenase